MTQIIGIDVSKDKLDCMWLIDIDSNKKRPRVFQNTADGFKLLVKWFKKDINNNLENIHIIVEATSIYHEALVYTLHDLDVKVSVVNPAYVRDYATAYPAITTMRGKVSLAIA